MLVRTGAFSSQHRIIHGTPAGLLNFLCREGQVGNASRLLGLAVLVYNMVVSHNST